MIGQRNRDEQQCDNMIQRSEHPVSTTRSVRFGWCAVIGITSCLVGKVLYAAEPFAAPRAAEPVASSPAAGLAQVTVSLLLVLAAVFAAAWAMRRLKGFGRLAPGAIEVVADVALGPKERAVLVQVGSKQLLLGVASGQVNTLHVLDEPVAVPPRNSVLGQSVSESSSRSTQVPPHLQFKTILKRSLGL